MSHALPEFAVRTDVGLRRDHNEDAYLADPAIGLWMVADGMGGHDAGEVASRLACLAVQTAIIAGRTLADALRDAHAAILRHTDEQRHARSMGTTAVAARVQGSDVEVAWVGDSRAYVFDGALRPVTRDHSYVGDLVEQGVIDAQIARHHPHRHVVTQALGVPGTDGLHVGTWHGTLSAGERILLCSDGLTEVLDDVEIEALLRERGNALDEVTTALIAAALHGGGPDNVTVLVIEMGR